MDSDLVDSSAHLRVRGESSRRDRDLAPLREPMRGQRSLERQWGELQSKLRRFWRQQLDRPWKDVLRELNTRMIPPGPLTRLWQQHLPQTVALDVVEVEGRLMRPGLSGLTPLAEKLPPSGLLYVCPRTGHLKRVSSGDSRHLIVVSDEEVIRQIGKRWYRLTLAPLSPRSATHEPCFDVVLGRLVNRPSRQLGEKLTRLYGRPGVFAVHRQQVARVPPVAEAMGRL